MDTESIIDKAEVKNYLGIDYADEMVDANLSTMILAADGYIKGAIGNEYDRTDPRAKSLLLVVIADMYDNRAMTSNGVTANVRKLVDDICLQLRLELRRKRLAND